MVTIMIFETKLTVSGYKMSVLLTHKTAISSSYEPLESNPHYQDENCL
jgi:hypothetical protein